MSARKDNPLTPFVKGEDKPWPALFRGKHNPLTPFSKGELIDNAGGKS
jgi:hypothetical protein